MAHCPTLQDTCSTLSHPDRPRLEDCFWRVWMDFASRQLTRNDKSYPKHRQWWNHLAWAPICSKSWSSSRASPADKIWIRSSDHKTVFRRDLCTPGENRPPRHGKCSLGYTVSRLFWSVHSSVVTRPHCHLIYNTCNNLSLGLVAHIGLRSIDYVG